MEGTARATGDDFFRSLVRNLAAALRVRYAFVAEFAGVDTRVRTLAFWTGEGFLDRCEFDIAGTPCEQVLRGEMRHYPQGVQALFPQDTALVTLGAESYLAIPLSTPSGSIVGHLAVIDKQPMPMGSRDFSVFKTFAARAGAELERKRAEEALQESEERYRTLYNDTPVMMHSINRGGRLVSVNDYWLKALGYKREEVIGQKVLEFLTPVARRYAIEVATPKIMQEGRVQELEVQNSDLSKIFRNCSIAYLTTPPWRQTHMRCGHSLPLKRLLRVQVAGFAAA